jgi:phosphatidylserine decarboxylase
MVKDAYRFALPPVILGVVLFVVHWRWAAAVLVFLGLFIFYFFRDPERVIPADPDVVVSPADGRVVEIVEEKLGNQPGRRVSIFLSVWDVHVNRAPVAGRIRRVEYRPGRFYAALRSRASTENEQNVISIAAPAGEMTFKQIAGAIARRVLCWKPEGSEVARGERIGMIRFGSRVDVWLPIESEMIARRGQQVYGGSSILAKWKSTA